MKNFINFMKTFFVQTQDNMIPRAYTRKAFISYAFISMFLIGVVSPFYSFYIDSLRATLTKDIIISQVNPAREIQSLLPLGTSNLLTKAAEMKAQDMLDRNYFSHNDPDGKRPWQWLDKVGYKYALAGENLAKDFYDVEPLVTAWLNSPSHARNILNDYFTEIGVGVATGDMNGVQTTVVAMFVARPITPVLETLAVQSGGSLQEVIKEGPVVTNEKAGEEILGEETSQESNKPQPDLANPKTQEPIQDAPSPDKLFVVRKATDKILQEENNLIQTSQNQPAFTQEGDSDFFLNIRTILVSKLPSMLKISLSGFLGVILAWLLISEYILKRGMPNFVQRALSLTFLVLILQI